MLDWLARDSAEHGYDLKRLVRGLVLTNAYARSSRWDGDKLPDDRLFAVASVRPLAPMQMATSLKLATADPQSLPSEPKKLEERIDAIEKNASGLANLFPASRPTISRSASPRRCCSPTTKRCKNRFWKARAP